MTMKNKPGRMVAALILSLMLVGWSGLPALADKEVTRMSIDELKGILDSKDLILLDVRAGKDWSSSELKIVGAMREDPKDFDSWADKYPKDKKIVLYCA
jgi:hypothetical protein